MKIFKKLFEGVDISTSSEKDRILLVETNDQDAFLRSAVLSDANYEISRAKNCLEAFKTLTSGINFQAVVTAFLLPDGTAIELLKRVQEQIPETILIVVADEIDESLILEAMQAGASYCIPTFESYQNSLSTIIKLSLEQKRQWKIFESNSIKSNKESKQAEQKVAGYRGQLSSSTTVPRLLRAFYQQQLTGAMHIRRDEKTTSLYFVDGVLVFANSSASETKIGQALVNTGKISEDELNATLRLMEKMKVRFGTALTMLGIIGLEELKSLIVHHVLKIVYSTFEWDFGEFIFEQGVRLDNDVVLSLSTADVIFAGIRHIKDTSIVERWLGDRDRILIPTSDPISLFQALTVTKQESEILEVIDHPMSVNKVITVAKASEEGVLRTLCGLIEIGMLVPIDTKSEGFKIASLKFSELFEKIPEQSEFDAQTAADFCYEVETFLSIVKAVSYYDMLGVTPETKPKKITDAFYKLARKFHPDRHHQLAGYNLNLKADLKLIFETLAQAFYTLSDEMRRVDYDYELASAGIPKQNLAVKINRTTLPLPIVESSQAGSGNYQTARLHYSKREFEKAREALVQAIAEDPKNHLYRIALARTLLKLPNYIKHAENSYLTAIQISPNTANYYAELALFYQRLLQFDQAREMIQKALKLDPDNPIAQRVTLS